MMEMGRRSFVLFLLAAMGVMASVCPVRGCILEFRSMDWQVAQSSLVLVGKVVEAAPTLLGPEWEGKMVDGLIRPSIATVEVEKVLYGATDAKRVKIRSGPIRSCALYPVHIEMDKGKRYIFILPAKTDEEYQLGWAGSVQEMTNLASVRDSVERCGTSRAEYLSWVGKEMPEMLSAGKALDELLLSASRQWPEKQAEAATPAELLHGLSDDNTQTAAADAVMKMLEKEEPTAIEAALALDFTRVQGWSSQPLWSQVAIRYAEDHAREAGGIQQREWSRLLNEVGATPKQIQDYFARVGQDQESATLAFPIVMPDPFTRISGGNLTTDFLLRSKGFDRGQVYFCYGMTPETLKTLDAGRVKNVLPMLLASNNDHLKWAATTAMAQMQNH